MTKLFWNILKLSPVVVATLFTANSALADEVSVSQLSQAGNADIAQGTSVSRLSDVQPTDWAFQALQSLVERYNCIVGYPNNTYRGNRALSRYEFAAGLNACLNQVNELIATSTADLVNKQDLATLQRLQEEFRSELATLRGRVDALEARTTFLENHQFSTTTKLQGEAVFMLDEAFGSGTRAVQSGTKGSGPAVTNNAVFSDRVRLNLITSFTGTDRLQTRLTASNTLNNANPGGPSLTSNGTGTNMTRLGIDGGPSSGNSVVLDKLNYAYTLGDKARIKIDATGAELFENANTFSSEFNPSGTGALSRYGRFSPIYRSSSDSSSGVTLTVNPNGPVAFTAAYIAEGLSGRTLPSSPTTGAGGQGVFNGDNTLFGQLEFKPNKAVALGLTYTHNYQEALSGLNANLFGGTGSSFANSPFGPGVATEANNYGVEVSFNPTAKVVLGGWGGYTAASTLDHTQRSADIWYWAATLAVKDFGKQGNTLGLIFGQPPKITSFNNGNGTVANTINGLSSESGTSYHLEGLYKAKISDNILVTPGLIVIFNPENNNNNNTEYVGTLRTTFTF
jgi:BMFP domain-containing protein YqiC